MVENSVKNQGTQAAPAFRVGIYLSVDTLITSTDILVASRDINALAVGTTSQASTPATVPTAIRSGKYFIGIWADNGNAIFETNESNNTALHLITVITKANQPPVAKAGGPYATPHNRFVRFDASASFDPDGDAMNFLWQFGDGTSGNGVTVTHFYTKDSLYTVILTVTDERGGIAQDTTTVRVFNRPPIAKANGPYVANRVTLLQFSSSGSSDPDDDPLEFSWDFGDFSTGIGPSPKHLYTELDTVKVVLTVKDGHGGQAHDTTTVFVINLPPEARFTFTPQRPRTLSDTVRFDASASKDADGAIRFYIWDFGDGSKPDSSGPKIWHLYKSLGDFVARLRVVDNEGASDDTTAGFRVRVEDRSQRQKIPDHFTLAQNYPNPYGRPDGFSSEAASTRIGYGVPVSAWVSLKIYNSLGQTVRTLVAAQHAPGFYETVWDGRDDFGREIPSGIYFYAMESHGVRFIRKITVLR
jgi:PKD repeat protein